MKTHTILVALATVVSAASALASNVGVVDSGTYFDHDVIKGLVWTNPGEIAGNRVDDDRNGKVDDINGWNFAENYGRVFFPEHIARINPVTYKIFNILSKIELGTATDEEQDFLKTKVKGLPDEQKKALLEHLNYYGQYAHSTHVSGIIAMGNRNVKIMSARIFPDAPPNELADPFNVKRLGDEFAKQSISTMNVFYKFMAFMTNQTFDQVAAYLKQTSMDVANMSIGIPLPNIAKQYLALTGRGKPTQEQIEQETQKVFAAFEPKGKKWMASSPDTLFVIAAGNDGENNDKLPTFPASVQADNAITVAASKGYREIAKFSNYGATGVHVAAPGVAIMSSVPGPKTDLQLPMSGTSMAAPYVSMVASNIKDLNKALKASEIKEVLMGTVDKKDWLAGKVVSSGVVNAPRAYRAAELSKSMTVADAIKTSREEIKDIEEVVPKHVFSHKRVDSELQQMADSLVF